MTSADPKVGIIVQARMGSTRLPGKILKEVLHKPLLAFELERLRRVKRANAIVIATTTNPRDLPIVEFCTKYGVECFRGDEDDVLSRYYECAVAHKFDIVVRITADCPLIDPEIIDQILETMLECKLYEYVSNTLTRTFPRGLDCEAFYFKNLEQAYEEATERSDREHVTLYMHRAIRTDLLRNISSPVNLSHHRWTVDTPEDFELIAKILEALYPKSPNFDFRDVLKLLDQHPDWVKLNSHIEQKRN